MGRTAPFGASSKRRGESAGITVTVACRRPDLAAALLDRLAGEQDCAVLGDSIRSSASLIRHVERHHPTVVLLDQRLLDPEVARSLRALSAERPATRVLLLCERVHAGLVEQILRHRFHGFLLADAAADTVAKAVRAIVKGELWLPRALLERAVLDAVPAAGDSLKILDTKLTRRESQVVEQLCQGLTNRQIAEELGITEDTVKKHLYRAYGKLGVQRRAELIARRSGVRSAGG